MGKDGGGLSLNPKTFRDTPICELCFEDALREGARKSSALTAQDFKETSIRFCIDGLYKWYKSYAKYHGKSSVFVMVKDASWYWSSFCGTDNSLTELVKGYYSLLKEITETTSCTDLAERLDEMERIEKIGRSGYPFSIVIPFECQGVINDCAVALGMPFSQFYQLGLAKAISANQNGLYNKWTIRKVDPLFFEVMGRVKLRVKSLRRIRNDLEFCKIEDAKNDESE